MRILWGATAFIIAACASAPPSAPTSVDAPVGTVASAKSDAIPPADAPRPDRFPAGPGVTLVWDDLQDLTHMPEVAGKAPYEDRLAFVRSKLGVEGEPEVDAMFDGMSFVAIGARGIGGPYNCSELIISKKVPSWAMRPADNRRCGLPYLEDSTKQYRGPGPRFTVGKLRLMLVEIQGMDPLTAELTLRNKMGAPDATTQPPEWTAIGPRGRDAPFTCHVLTLGSPARVFEAPVERCSLVWPLPASRFDPGPPVPPIDKAALAADCQKKCGSDMCMLTQKNMPGSSLRPEADGSRARYADGRPVKTDITQSCVPIPAGCSPVTSSCFFPPPPPGTQPTTGYGPCPKDDYGGYSFAGTPPHIECYGRYKAAP